MSPERRSAPPRPKRVDIPTRTEADSPAPSLQEQIALAPDEPPYETRPRFSRGEEVPLLGNDELARIFYEIGDMLEIQGEMPFKIGAYRRAAESLAHSPIDIARAYREGRPPRLPGVGKAIDEKLEELADTGRLRYYERLRRDVPPSVVTLLQVPGLGPRTAGDLYRQAGIDSLDALEAAASAGQLREMKGMTAKTEARLLEGLKALRARPPRRMRLGQTQEIVERVTGSLRNAPGVKSITPAGSYRRRRETVADIDLLVETDDPAAVIGKLQDSPWVESTGNGVRPTGGTRTSVQISRGPQVDLMTMAPGAAGTYLVHFTGSAAHNVRLREIARDRGWSLSEHGFTSLDDETKRVTFETEREV